MPHCRVYNCNGHSGMAGIRMLCFPQNRQKALRWLVLCRCEIGRNVENYKITPNDRVCSRHFTENDFGYSKQDELLNQSGATFKKEPTKCLKEDVFPHLNMPREDSVTPRTSTHLAVKESESEKQERKRSCDEMLGVTPKVLFTTPQSQGNILHQKKSVTPATPARRRTKKSRSVECVTTSTQTEPQPSERPVYVSSSTQTPLPPPIPPPPTLKDMETQVPELKPFACPRAVQKDHAYSSISKKKKRKGKVPQAKASTKKKVPTFRPDNDVIDEPNDDLTDQNDKDYVPSDEDESSDDEVGTESSIPEKLVNQRKFIVFESQLNELFLQARCSICGRYFVLEPNYLESTIGSGLCVKLECINRHSWVWYSQPMLGRMPIGNLLICAAILFSGQTFTHIGSFAGFLNLEFVSESTYGSHQSDYLFPTVHESFESEREALWSSLDSKAVRLSGDGRCDSPGYSAKFCTYTVMDMDTEKVVDFEVVQVTQATSSVAMEKLGFHTIMNRLLDSEMNVVQICTDRHVGINCLMNNEFKDIDHQVDVWHLGKSIFKRLIGKSKQSDCQDLQLWLPSIRNHLWWCSATCNGDPVLLQEKWRSLAHHVTNKHEWDANQVFHQCEHAPIDPAVARKKKWLKSDSPAHKAVVATLNDTRLLKGVKKITAFCHTGQLEVFNGMLTKYTPKRQHFPHESMVVRTKLAVLDHNHNTGRQQAVVKRPTARSAPAGSLRFKVVCPKAKKEWVAKPIYEGKRYDHVYDMMASVVSRKMVNDKESIFNPPDLPANIAPHERGPKQQRLDERTTRFNKQ